MTARHPAPQAVRTGVVTVFDVISDFFGGYKRLRCPHCPMSMRFRGVSDEEARRLRGQFAEHVAQHQAKKGD